MKRYNFLTPWTAAIVMLLAGSAQADPPSVVARLGYLNGVVSFSPAGEDVWLQATLNRPLITGDRLWVPDGNRTELQTINAMVRIAGGSQMNLLNISDRITQLELTRGTIVVRIPRNDPSRSVEVGTPNLALTMRRAGTYRIMVDSADDSTTVIVRDGSAEVYGDNTAYVIRAGDAYEFFGTGVRDFDRLRSVALDQFDLWARDRDRRLAAPASARYVSSDVLGYEELDRNGSWRTIPSYGPVWFPREVSSSWAPYTAGNWSWIEPWGWTWIDDAPWGFAVSHYGRWASVNSRWGWVPGPARERAVYAPALVAFLGADAIRPSSGGGGVAWFPLAPREVYRPAYPVSREYFARLNRSNTLIDDRELAGRYAGGPQSAQYVNREVRGAVVSVPRSAFIDATPVARVAQRMDPQYLVAAPVVPFAAVAPIQRSVVGTAPAGTRPPEQPASRPLVVRTAPPPAVPDFAARQSALTQTPGAPLAPADVLRLKPQGRANAQPEPQRTVVTAPSDPSRAIGTVQPQPADASGGQRGRRDADRPGERGPAAVPQPATIPSPSQPATQSPAQPTRPDFTPGAPREPPSAARPGMAPPTPPTAQPARPSAPQPAQPPVAQPAQQPAAQPNQPPQPPQTGRPGLPPQPPQPALPVTPPPQVTPPTVTAPAPTQGERPGGMRDRGRQADQGQSPVPQSGARQSAPQPQPPQPAPVRQPSPAPAAPAVQSAPAPVAPPQAAPTVPSAPPPQAVTPARPPERRQPGEAQPAPSAVPAATPPGATPAPPADGSSVGKPRGKDQRSPEEIKREEEERKRTGR